MLSNVLSVFAVVIICAGSCTGQLLPLLPSIDPFYQAPAGFESQAPGAILRSRKIASAYFGLIPNPVQAWQLLYRTSSINGSAIASATTVFKPLNAKLDRFVSFQTAYDGAARNGVCNPSYNYRLGAPQVDLISSVEFLLLQAYIYDGHIVSSPDYEGPDAAFGAGRLAGTGVLDSIRAVNNFGSTLGFFTKTPKVVGYGYSGGGIATGWAASLHSTYAPELNIKGWASGGTPANLTGTAVFIDGTLFAGFLPQSIAGLSAPSSYGAQVLPIIAKYATQKGKNMINSAAQICGVENLFTFAFQAVTDPTITSLGSSLFYEPSVAAVLGQNIMGLSKAETPAVPVYLYHATSDEIIPYANASAVQKAWCSYDASVQFVSLGNGGHATAEILGFPGAFNFVKAAFDGTPTEGCSQSTILDDTLNPLALGASLEPLFVGLLNALAIAGRKDANIINDITNLNKTVVAT